MTDDDFNDADLTHPWATRWRIPVVRNPYPHWKYEVALVVPDESANDYADLWGAVWPTEAEAELVGWYIGYRREWYNERYRQIQASRALDVDSGTNTQILMKSERGWHYRRMTFDHGVWPPPFGDDAARFAPTVEGLSALLDHMNSHPDHSVQHWREYRETRPPTAVDCWPGFDR